VSRICAQLDAEVAAWRNRPLDHTWFPYVFCDATYVKVRLHGRVVSQAVVVATGVSIDGRREILGHAVGDAETEAFWADFLRSLRDRGLAVSGPGRLGVSLVISDAHRGLRNAIGQILPGAAWQRCRVHFMRNLLARVPRRQSGMVAAMVRTIFAQPSPEQVRAQLDAVGLQLADAFPGAAELLLDAKADLTAFAGFPQAHWTKIWSNNPIERLNREIKRRTDVVGIFPNPAAVDRLVGAILIEAHDEWQASERRYLSEASMAELTRPQHAALNHDTAALNAA
jgi:putative transposase